MPLLRDGSRTSDLRLSRVVWFDPASRGYGVRALLDVARPLRTRTWRCDTYLDQTRQGACAGFAFAHGLAAEPRPVQGGIDEAFARETLYAAARELEPFGSSAARDMPGSTILASAKALRRLGLIAEYRWAFDLDEVLATLSQLGPVVLGMPWYEGMASPSCCGMLHPTGRRTGAHAILARGIDVRRKTILLHNSWGRSWGNQGTALLHWDDLAMLIDRSKQAEACVLIKSARTGPVAARPPDGAEAS